MDGYVTIGTELDTKSFDAQIDYVKSQLEEIEYKLKQADMGFEVGDVQKLEAEYEKLTIKLGNLVRKKEELNKTDFSGIKNSIDKIGNSVEKVTKKVGHWALAVFGIRSAYSAVRSAMSTLSQYDDQMAVNIEWIRYLLASTLKPIIETLINLAFKLLAYINAIAKAWFHVDLFANASTEAFEKNNRSLKGSVKQAKELNKQLAGFDEMNVLQENGDVSSGGGGGGVTLPDFGAIEDVKIPSWLQWIIDHKEEILPVFAGIVGFLKTAGKYIKKLGLAKGLRTAVGIGIAIGGIVYAIEGLIDFIKDPSFENFIKILEGIALAVTGVAIAIGAWPVAVAGAVALIVIEIVKHFDEIKGLFRNVIKWLDTNVLGGLRKIFGPLGDVLYAPIKFFVEMAYGAFTSFYGGIKKVIEGVVLIFQGDFLGGIKKIFGGILDIVLAPFKGLLNGIKGVIELAIDSFNHWKSRISEIFNKIKDIILWPFKVLIEFIGGLWGKIKDSINGILKNIKDVFNKIKDALLYPFNKLIEFVKGLWGKITGGITDVYNGIKDKFVEVKDEILKPFNEFIDFVKGLWDKIKGAIKELVDNINNALSKINPIKIGVDIGKGVGSVGNKIKSFFGFAKGGIVVPKLASGGIINQPGRGVPIGSAVGGERGMEGVIPLTDSQQMELLGEAIGKYITINANIVNTMNGRIISKELQKINAENDFAYNR